MKSWYKKHVKDLLSEEKGMTLVEILASILILSLVVTTFLSFFIQAAKTNNQTDTVNEATFIAQESIELLTYYSKTKSVEEALKMIETENAKEKSGFKVESNIFKKSDETLYTGTVNVSKEGKAYAQMETRLSFETAKEIKY
ncbi:type IV pilus modification PilV family protein [Carnobacterium funditum]|uniref:type IV pilus modification PilV family protein n=1 Tax=Carnobacterium funditum TaxID=2752 RepID=UPI0005513832|nr:type II secretion system protein [Carnobacterium funditum]